MGTQFQFGMKIKGLEPDGGDAETNANVLNATEMYT